jgi:hypothetical protein
VSSVARKVYGVLPERRPDWQNRLHAWLDHAKSQRMVYGQTDCALTCADEVWWITGRDVAGHLRGRYFSEVGAAKIVRRAGGLAGLATSLLGAPYSDERLAHRGDIAMIEQTIAPGKTIEVLGVLVLDRVWVRADEGMEWRPRSAVTVAWPVGHEWAR